MNQTPEQQAMDELKEMQAKGSPIPPELIAKRAFDITNPPEDPPPMVRLGAHGIFTAANLSAFVADRKAGKSSALAALMGAIMAPPNTQADFLGFTAENPQERAVVHFDTEQSPADHHALVMRSLRRAGLSQPPPWFTSYQLTGLCLADKIAFVDEVCRIENEKHGGLQMVIIDGIADLCCDPNDQEESFALVEKWHNFSVNEKCVVLVVLHLNPGTEKSRGHLGSQLERKVETPLIIKKSDDGVSTMFCTHARKAHIKYKDGFSFQWCDNAKMHVTVSQETVQQAKDTAKHNKARDEAHKAMAAGELMAHSALVDAIMGALDLQARAAKSRIASWYADGIIIKHPCGSYSRP